VDHVERLCGLLVSPAKMSRLEDDADGTPRFHLSFHVRNDEASHGWIQVKDHYDLRHPFRLSGVTRVPPFSAVHVGLVLKEPPRALWLHPYFSRNAGTVLIPITETAPHTGHDGIVVGSEPSTWRPKVDGIVVDDLSPGLSVIDERRWFGLAWPGSAHTVSDGIVGLPSNRESPGQTGWSRDWAPASRGSSASRTVSTAIAVSDNDAASPTAFGRSLSFGGPHTVCSRGLRHAPRGVHDWSGRLGGEPADLRTRGAGTSEPHPVDLAQAASGSFSRRLS